MEIQNKDFKDGELLVMTEIICGIKSEWLRCNGRNDLSSLEDQAAEKPEK